MHGATGTEQFAVGADIVLVTLVPDEARALEDAILSIAFLPYWVWGVIFFFFTSQPGNLPVP
jgi:hypothetical protein